MTHHLRLVTCDCACHATSCPLCRPLHPRNPGGGWTAPATIAATVAGVIAGVVAVRRALR